MPCGISQTKDYLRNREALKYLGGDSLLLMEFRIQGQTEKNVTKSYGHLFNGPPPLATFLPLDAFASKLPKSCNPAGCRIMTFTGNSHGHSIPSPAWPVHIRGTSSTMVDARNHKLLPGDKQLLHLLAKAQRRSVRYTIVTGWCTIDIDVDRDLQQFQWCSEKNVVW